MDSRYVKILSVAKWLASVFPFKVAEDGAFDPDEEIPSFIPSEGSPVKTQLKTSQVPFKGKSGIGKSLVFEVISGVEADLPFRGKLNVP